jgi:hypothetical protein
MTRFSIAAFFLLSTLFLQGQHYEQLPRSFGTTTLSETVGGDELPSIRIYDNGVTGVSVIYRTGDPDLRSEVVDGELWDRVRLEGYPMSQDVGKPQLPARSEVVMVPAGAAFDYTFTYTGTTIAPGFRVYPVLSPATDRYGDPEPEFAYDSVTYATNAFWPASPVRMVTVQELRGMQVVWFDIMPFAFNPVTGELMRYDEITLEVTFQGASQFMDYTLHSDTWLRNFPLVASNAGSIAAEINEHISQSESTNTQAVAGYIILTDPLFIDAATKFADWKRQLGYRVDVVARTGWTFQAMKDSVAVRYQQWVPKPDYLLIIGDHDRLPAQMLLNPDNILFGSDLHLVTMGQQVFGHLPDMAQGRLSVISSAQAMTVVDKIIRYEMNPPADSSFYLSGLNAAQFQDDNFDYHCDRRFVHTSEEVRDYLLSKGYNIHRVYYADTTNSTPLYYNQSHYSNGQSLPPDLLSPTFNWKGNATHIRNHINNGVFYVLHRDHGYAGGTGWHAPYYVTSHIGQLTNGDKTPVVFSINCHTGEFTLPECFAERFQRHASGGAVGVVAASYYSYSGWNDGLTIGMFDAIWSQPGLVPAFGAGGIFAPVSNPHPNIRNMGFVINHGLIRMTQTWSSALIAAQYQYRLFHYFGDPAMRIRTAVPTPITAQHADSIPCNAPALHITGASYPNAVATLTIPGKTIGITTLSNGAGNIPMVPFASPYLILTINGPEHKPHIDTIWVIPTPLSVQTTINPVRCNNQSDGGIILNVFCGVEPFTISWAHGSSTSELYNLPAGTYHFSVTDATSTTVSDSVTLTQPATPIQVQASVTKVKCYYGNTGGIDLLLQGGVPPYQVLWSNGHQTPSVSGLIAGKYHVKIIDSAGCVVTDTFTVTQPLPLQIGEHLLHDAGNCSGAATALPSGGTPPYTYLWNDSDAQTTQTAAGLCPGTYRVWVTDSNQCVTVRNFTIHNVSGIVSHDPGVMLLFPNPLDGEELTIVLPEGARPSTVTVRVLNAIGQELYHAQHHPEAGTLRIRPFPESKGVKFVIIRSEHDGILLQGKVIRM